MSDKEQMNNTGRVDAEAVYVGKADADKGFGVTQPAVRPAATNRGPSPVVWAMLAVSALLALAVIFVLPGVVEQYELPFTPRAEITTPVVPAGTAAPVGNPISPFEEAQKARQRAEAQDVLASLLDRQSELELLMVSAWAPDAYQAAIEFARLGDEAYRTQEFAQATAQYRQSDAALAALLDSVPAVFSAAVTTGNAALEAGDATLASNQFTRALTLRPQDAEAQSGLARAATLEQVTQLMDEAATLIAGGELPGAETQLQQAIGLDPLHQSARDQLAQVRSQLADNSFNAVMSEGFAALQSGNSDSAIAAFERALAMRPGSQQALEAITQTRDQLAVDQITAHQNSAKALEAEEKWEAAVAEYDAALAIDLNLVFAQQGRDYAQKRLQLDRLLQSAIEQPARLGDAAVHAQAVQVFYTGRSLENPGPRLQQQLTAVESLLEKAQVPAEVQLVSDNLTEVTLYQVGVLGRFESQVLMLKPENYVAVGTRAGYRDVRAEFEVGFDGRSTPVTITCIEEVVAVNRR